MKDILDTSKFLVSMLKKMENRKIQDIDLTYAIKITQSIGKMLDEQRSKLDSKQVEREEW